MSETYQHGELVNITIRGARVREVKYYGDGQGPCLKFEYATPNGQTMPDAVFYDQPAITVERHQEPDPEFPATKAGGHSLTVEYGDCELYGTCQCGKDLGSIRPNQSLDTTLAQAWERHVMTEVPRV